jgi:hypothetical protein
MFIPRHLYLSVNPCETEFCIHAWVFCGGFSIYSQRRLPLACARWDFCFRWSHDLFHSRWSRNREWLFLLHSYPCSHELQTTVDFQRNFGVNLFQHLRVLNRIIRTLHAVFDNHQTQPHSLHKPSSFHVFLHHNPSAAPKARINKNLVLMLHFRHLCMRNIPRSLPRPPKREGSLVVVMDFAYATNAFAKLKA